MPLKTVLPAGITTVQEAKDFLKALYHNGESYHPEDDAHEIVWDMKEEPNKDECDRLNKLMEDIYNLAGNDGRHVDPMIFDPCEYLGGFDIEQLRNRAMDWFYDILIDYNKIEPMVPELKPFHYTDVHGDGNIRNVGDYCTDYSTVNPNIKLYIMTPEGAIENINWETINKQFSDIVGDEYLNPNVTVLPRNERILVFTITIKTND